MADQTTLLDLPVDLLLLIFPYLDARSFLSLTSICKALHKTDFLHEPSYWSSLVRTTFRVPNQPVIQNDGQRWQKLYKRLLTQSRIYTWGNNEKGCLGHSYLSPEAVHRTGPPGLRHARALRQRHISWPEQMESTQELGVVSDLQCGGWSTTLLTSKGALYTVGVLDGAQFNQRRPPYMQRAMQQPEPLRYPPGFVQPSDRYDVATAIKQFSAGRGHVLGLSDSGWIWSWQNIEQPALHVKFVHHETVENGIDAGPGVVKKVVGGWNKSAALIEGTGIVLWEPLRREEEETEIEDAALVLETAVVPSTSFVRSKGGRQSQDQGSHLPEAVGEVLNYVVLERVLLFNTHLGKIFAAQILWSDNEQRISEPVELIVKDSPEQDASFVTDVQGSFHNFALFLRSGAVLTCNQDRLMDMVLQRERTSSPEDTISHQDLFTRIPALQHRDVISVAFGDYHFHALHSTGHITSYGNEPKSCGALGLGGHGDPEGRLRGIRYAAMAGDGRLVPHAYMEGRRVWFEEGKRYWIKFLTSGGVDAEEAAERVRMAIGSPDVRCQGEISEWIEQEGRDWESKFGLTSEDDDGLGAYFALSVTAAGWHSGALVLVNEDLAKKLKQAIEVPDPNIPKPSSSHSGLSQESEQAGEAAAGTADSTSLLTWATNTALDYGRWFFGLPPYNVGSTNAHLHGNATANGVARPVEYVGATAQMGDFQRGTHPLNYGASPRVGVKYVWANDRFPRLKLSDGTEMPGSDEKGFDEWRYGRPEWNLSFEL